MLSLLGAARGQRSLPRRLLALPLGRNSLRIEKKKRLTTLAHKKVKKRNKKKRQTKTKEEKKADRVLTATHSFQARNSGIPGGGGSHRVLLSSSYPPPPPAEKNNILHRKNYQV